MLQGHFWGKEQFNLHVFFIIGYFASVYRCCDICLFCFHYFYYVLYVFYFSVLSFLYYILLIRVHLENNLHQPKYYMYKLFITKSINICETIQDFNHTQYIPFHRSHVTPSDLDILYRCLSASEEYICLPQDIFCIFVSVCCYFITYSSHFSRFIFDCTNVKWVSIFQTEI